MFHNSATNTEVQLGRVESILHIKCSHYVILASTTITAEPVTSLIARMIDWPYAGQILDLISLHTYSSVTIYSVQYFSYSVQ